MVGEGLEGFTAELCKVQGGVLDECGLISFPAVRLGSEVGCVSLNHEASCRASRCGGADFYGGFKRGDAAEGDQAAKRKDSLGIRPCADEAVKNRPHRGVKFLIDCERIVERLAAFPIARVNDDVELGGGGQFEVRTEKFPLPMVENFLVPAIRCWVVVVEASLADRADAGICGKSGKLLRRVVRRVVDIAGVDADAGVNGGVLCDFEVCGDVAERGCESYEASDICCVRACEQLGNFLRSETVRGKVAVRIR